MYEKGPEHMPILQREVSVFPEDLLDGPVPACAGSQQRWWALFTKSRQEKALARDLLSREIPFYLPMVAHDRYIRGRRVQAHLPVFSGYVFLYGDETQRYTSLTTNRVARVLPVEDGNQLRHDLLQIHRLIATNAPLTVQRRLCPGQPARIKNGPMRGVEGVITQRRGRRLLLVSVHFLQTGVSIEIDDFMVEAR